MKIYIALAIICLLSFPACSTTRNTDGTSTTSFDANSPAAQAAISAATQIAVSAANSAIQNYLGPQNNSHARHAKVSLADHPKLAAAEQAAEKSISRAQPKLPKATVHKITVKAFQARLLEENTASFRDPAESTP